MKINFYQKHKHCKPDCVEHNRFVLSLRKYNSTTNIIPMPIIQNSKLSLFQKQTLISVSSSPNKTTIKKHKKDKTTDKISWFITNRQSSQSRSSPSTSLSLFHQNKNINKKYSQWIVDPYQFLSQINIKNNPQIHNQFRKTLQFADYSNCQQKHNILPIPLHDLNKQTEKVFISPCDIIHQQPSNQQNTLVKISKHEQMISPLVSQHFINKKINKGNRKNQLNYQMFNLNDKGSFKKNNGEKRKKCHGDFLNI